MLLPISQYAMLGTVINYLQEQEGIHLEFKAWKVS
jgi:hypothetical protein